MITTVRSLGFLVALAGMIPLGAQHRPAVQLTIVSAELAEGDALRASVKAEGLSGQPVVLVEGATLLAGGELNLNGEAELVVRNLAPGRRRIMARLPRRMDLRGDVGTGGGRGASNGGGDGLLDGGQRRARPAARASGRRPVGGQPTAARDRGGAGGSGGRRGPGRPDGSGGGNAGGTVAADGARGRHV